MRIKNLGEYVKGLWEELSDNLPRHGYKPLGVGLALAAAGCAPLRYYRVGDFMIPENAYEHAREAAMIQEGKVSITDGDGRFKVIVNIDPEEDTLERVCSEGNRNGDNMLDIYEALRILDAKRRMLERKEIVPGLGDVTRWKKGH